MELADFCVVVRSLKLTKLSKLKLAFLFLPVLVFTIITPAAALDPYIAEAAPSFKTEIASISLGSTLSKSCGTPSTIYNGALLPIVVAPLTNTDKP